MKPTSSTHYFRYDVSGQPPLDAYGMDGPTGAEGVFVLSSMEVQVHVEEDGTIVPYATLQAHRRKKDGTPSRNVSRIFYSPGEGRIPAFVRDAWSRVEAAVRQQQAAL